jgi:DNA-directed RNA polymerase specialized sigma subunit
MAEHNREDLASRTLDDLLRLLPKAGDEPDAVQEEVLRRATPIVEQVIEESFSSTGFSKDDLLRPGYLGLLNAVYNFDLSHGKSFREYAENLIKGEIRQHIRDRSNRPSVPAWMNDLNRQLEMAEARLSRETGRLPTLRELAEAVNITEEGIAEIFKARDAISYVSLDAQHREHDPVPEIDVAKIRGARPTPFPIEHRIKIASALERLAELQQQLFHSLFRSKGQ